MKKILAILSAAAIASFPFMTAYAESAPEADLIPDLAYIPKWDEQTVTEQFSSFTADNGKSYVSCGTEIAVGLTGVKLCDITLTGYDIYSDMSYCRYAEAYTITNISEEYAAAVKFMDDEKYYVYKSYDCVPDTLGELIDSLDLENTISFGSMYVNDLTAVNDYDRELVKSLLLDNRDCTAEKDYNEAEHRIVAFSVHSDLLGIENRTFTLTDDGYLTTNIMEYRYAFYIGKDAVETAVDLLGISPDNTPQMFMPLETENPYEFMKSYIDGQNFRDCHIENNEEEGVVIVCRYEDEYKQVTSYASYYGLTSSITILLLEEAAEIHVRGDVSGDGKVSVSDAVLMQKYLTRQTDTISDAADLNNDEKVNVFDYVTLRKIILNF